MVALPAVPSGRAVHVVVALAAMMVSAAVMASLLVAPAPQGPPPAVMRPRVWTERMPDPPPPPVIHYAEPPPPAFTTGIAACDDYIAEIELYGRCERLPQQTRDAMNQAVLQVKAAWKDLPRQAPSAAVPTAEACRQALDAIRQAAESMDCGVQAGSSRSR